MKTITALLTALVLSGCSAYDQQQFGAAMRDIAWYGYASPQAQANQFRQQQLELQRQALQQQQMMQLQDSGPTFYYDSRQGNGYIYTW
jgi:hypothetical protein